MSNKKETNFELNLLPVISLLAVNISFLLLTAVWVHIGALNMKQAVGSETNENTKNPPTMMVTFTDSKSLVLSFSNLNDNRKKRKIVISSRSKKVNWNRVENIINDIATTEDTIKTVLIRPKRDTNYEDLMQLMSEIKKNKIKDVGIEPI